jgi:hypothetical protein
LTGGLAVFGQFCLIFLKPQNPTELGKVQVPTIGQQSFPLLMLTKDRWLLGDETKIILLENQTTAWETTLFGIPQKFPETVCATILWTTLLNKLV